MQYELENVECQHCKQDNEVATVQHGIMYDFWDCEYCHRENRV